MGPAEEKLPLEGIKVLAFTHAVMGPAAGLMLADLGAEVILIEPPTGDPARRYGPFPGEAPDPEKSGQFLYLNSNKKGVVLDLRGNPGGFLEQADTMANIFLDKGQEIVSVRQRGDPTITHVTTQKALAPAIPVVILTDGRTASASEIVAGALQDHDRALVLGTT